MSLITGAWLTFFFTPYALSCLFYSFSWSFNSRIFRVCIFLPLPIVDIDTMFDIPLIYNWRLLQNRKYRVSTGARECWVSPKKQLSPDGEIIKSQDESYELKNIKGDHAIYMTPLWISALEHTISLECMSCWIDWQKKALNVAVCELFL